MKMTKFVFCKDLRAYKAFVIKRTDKGECSSDYGYVGESGHIRGISWENSEYKRIFLGSFRDNDSYTEIVSILNSQGITSGYPVPNRRNSLFNNDFTFSSTRVSDWTINSNDYGYTVPGNAFTAPAGATFDMHSSLTTSTGTTSGTTTVTIPPTANASVNNEYEYYFTGPGRFTLGPGTWEFGTVGGAATYTRELHSLIGEYITEGEFARLPYTSSIPGDDAASPIQENEAVHPWGEGWGQAVTDYTTRHGITTQVSPQPIPERDTTPNQDWHIQAFREHQARMGQAVEDILENGEVVEGSIEPMEEILVGIDNEYEFAEVLLLAGVWDIIEPCSAIPRTLTVFNDQTYVFPTGTRCRQIR